MSIATFLGSMLLRGTAVVTLALIVARCVRRKGGTLRHSLWTTAFAGLLLLPLAAALLPSWEVGVLPSTSAQSEGKTTSAIQSSAVQPPAASSPPPEAAGPRETTIPRETATTRSAAERTAASAVMAVTLWSAGSLTLLVAMAVSLVRARRLAQGTRAVDDPSWLADLDAARRQLSIGRAVDLRIGSQVSVPMTGGFLRPAIFLPESAAGWAGEQRRLVLQHELVHVRRGDALRHLAVRAGVALYWFHPLVWWASRLAAAAREEACDEAVVGLGARPSSYAALLLELASGPGSASAPIFALPIVQPRLLETRVMSVLAPQRRSTSAKPALAVSLLVGLLALGLAIVQPVETVSAQPARGPVASVAIATAIVAPGSDVPSCRDSIGTEGNFHGTITTQDDGVSDFSGSYNGDRAVLRRIDGLTLCLHADGDVDFDADGKLSRLGAGGSLLLQAAGPGIDQRMAIGKRGDLRFQVDGKAQPADAQALAWRDCLLEVLGGLYTQAQIAGLDDEGKTAEIETQIAELDVDRRAAEIEQRLESALAELHRLVDQIGVNR